MWSRALQHLPRVISHRNIFGCSKREKFEFEFLHFIRFANARKIINRQRERESVHFIVLWYSRKHLLFTETVNMFRMRSHFFRRMCFCCCCCCFFGKSTHIIFQAPFASAKTNGIIFFLRQISLFRLCSYVYLCAVFFLFLHFSSYNYDYIFHFNFSYLVKTVCRNGPR